MKQIEEKIIAGSWKPDTPSLKVRLRDNPGRQGTTTGRTKMAGSFNMVEVDFGPNEKQFKRYDLLELVQEEAELFDLLLSGTFGGPGDLRRVLTFEKIKGSLTNVFYSMEASNTDFYAHQFKPVMRFIESPVGRMLIADEVGLGKTIEATYIWKEIQARHSARRLLVVCPAMLREKWKNDLRVRFNISSQIIPAKGILERLEDIAAHRTAEPFVCITSLEGLRPPANFEDETTNSVRARFARLLDQNIAAEEFSLFDYVIIDEAHYLRNPSTANNRLGRLLREAARHLILLTATPMQIGSDNLYQLLRLIDPDEFYNSFLFQEMLSANSSIVKAQRALWQNTVDIESALNAIGEAEKSDYFRNDSILERIKSHIQNGLDDPEEHIEVLRLLEGRSLLSQYMTRSRKREVLEQRVERAAQVLEVSFSPAESAVYNHVTARVRAQSIGKSGVSLFSLIARQRQMASSIVGAIESWREKNILEELLWEDFGLTEDLAGTFESSHEEDHFDGVREDDDTPIAYGTDFDIATLEKGDTKYNNLINFLKLELQKCPTEKFVIFAFYRGTLKYLARRLEADGIDATLIMGAMGDQKDAVIEEFAKEEGPSVLLSSEVGSEGIDLQFCRFLVNYDLPWNPMRVEQRIGRLDRLGQKAERISIINLVVENTIEDRILMRLYNRINVFRESIGDLEDILGKVTSELMIDLLDPNLSDEEREKKSIETTLAVQNTQKQSEELEQEAVNLVGFSDYILDQIKDTRQRGRWLSGGELRSLVDDFFARKYPGTKIETAPIESGAQIVLSDDARRDLSYFINEKKPATRTRMHQSRRPVIAVFDPRRTGSVSQDVEFIEPGHPLTQWIRAIYEEDQSQLHRITALKLSSDNTAFERGDYVFSAHRWAFEGLKMDQFLAFRAYHLDSRSALNGADSESLVTESAENGNPFPNALNLISDIKVYSDAVLLCEENLADAFGSRIADFEAENSVRCDQQETSAKKYAKRRIDELRERVARFKTQGKTKPIPMTQGLIRKEEEQLRAKTHRIAMRREVDPTMVPLAAGIIRVG